MSCCAPRVDGWVECSGLSRSSAETSVSGVILFCQHSAVTPMVIGAAGVGIVPSNTFVMAEFVISKHFHNIHNCRGSSDHYLWYEILKIFLLMFKNDDPCAPLGMRNIDLDNNYLHSRIFQVHGDKILCTLIAFLLSQSIETYIFIVSW